MLTAWPVPRLGPFTTVVLVNLGVHKHTRVKAVIEAAGCRLVYVPPYSLDFNLSELIFANSRPTWARRSVAQNAAAPATLCTVAGQFNQRSRSGRDASTALRRAGPSPGASGRRRSRA